MRKAKAKKKGGKFVPTCFGCGERGHIRPRCPKTNTSEVQLCEKVDQNQFVACVKYDVGDVLIEQRRTSVKEVMMAKNGNDNDLHLVAILDTGCMQSVVGEETLKKWQRVEKVARFEKTETTFTFGDGRTVC